MQKLNLKNYQIKKSKINSERSLILSQFLERLNQDRRPPYPPLQAKRLAIKLSYLSTSQLKEFWGDCNYASNFSKYFWWATNPKNAKDKTI